jgi:hypothetical protein
MAPRITDIHAAFQRPLWAWVVDFVTASAAKLPFDAWLVMPVEPVGHGEQLSLLRSTGGSFKKGGSACL